MGFRKIALCFAGDEEIAAMAELAAPLTPENTGSALSCFSASLEERQLILTMSGVGKVNAALAAGFLLKRFQPDLIISAGVCGSLTGELGIGQTVLATGVYYHDMQMSLMQDFYPSLEGPEFVCDPSLTDHALTVFMEEDCAVRAGKIATGDVFVEGKVRERLDLRAGTLACDMESAAVAQAAHAYRVPFMALRTVTDTPEHEGQDVFGKNCLSASKVNAALLVKLILSLPH